MHEHSKTVLPKRKSFTPLIIWTGLGLAFGVIVGVMMENLTLGIMVGIALGLTMGISKQFRQDKT